LKIVPCVRFVNAARTRAILAVGGITLMGALAVGSGETAHAAGATPASAPVQLFGVHPVQEGRTTLPGGHFNFALVPGQRIADAIVVENFSDHSLRFQVYSADLLTAAGGGLAPAQPTATMREVGAWITVSVPAVTVAAHGQFTDPFTVTVPKSVSSGQHLGALVAAADIGLTAQGNPIQARAALIAVVTVPGVADAGARLTPLVGSEAQPGRVAFRLTLSNTGNVLLTYAGVLVIDDADGHRVTTLTLTPANAYVVPSGQVPLAAAWEEPAPPADMYRAQATVTVFANGKPVRVLTSQSLDLRLTSGVPAYVPLTLAGALVALLVLAAWIARDVARRRHTPVASRVRGARTVA
jgi:hypothetical protein